MKKSRHHNFIDTIDEIASIATERKIAHLHTEDAVLNGRIITVNNQELVHFGSCSYLGLEVNDELKEGAIEAVLKYGTQFSSSRSYIGIGLYNELETLVSQMFGNEVVIAPSTTLAHIAAIPVLVSDEDAIILDQQVHMSVQSAVQLTRHRGVHIEVIRHNRMDKLEERVIALSQKHAKIWYMADGVYSMYGDFAPIYEIAALMDKYEQLNLYVDDAHGMSCFGKNGRGYILNEVEQTEKMVVTSSMAKAFGTGGGIMCFKNKAWKDKVKKCGATLIYSGPIQPPMLGASIASARIHLSDEIYRLQDNLQERIHYCHSLLEGYGLPVISNSKTPVFFVGVGLPKVGYNLVKRLMEEGHYTNLGIFPAVAIKNTGIRFTITNHHTFQDIERLVSSIAANLPRALEEENRNIFDVYQAFGLKSQPGEQLLPAPVKNSSYSIQHEQSIENIDRKLWNTLFAGQGTFDWDGMKFIEMASSGNELPEHNWEFHYFIIRNMEGKVVLATFFSLALWKDDMLSPAAISRQVEEARQTDPYYLTSKVLSMGSMASEGNHLYLNKQQGDWKEAMALLLDTVSELQEKTGATSVTLRDFSGEDEELTIFLQDEGFVKITMPETHVVKEMTWSDTEEYLNSLSKRSKRHIKYDVLRHEHMFDIEVKQQLSEAEREKFYELYRNVKDKSYDVNVFAYPERLLEIMNEYDNWEFVCIKLKPEFDDRAERQPIAMFFGYHNDDSYSAPVVGIDYDYLHSHKIYKQALYQMVKRAWQLKKQKCYLGFTATMEKQKLGAIVENRVAYVQAKDNYNMAVLGMMSAAGN